MRDLRNVVIAAFLSSLFLMAGIAHAQLTVPQGGTGVTTVPAGYVLVGSSALHLTTVSTTTASCSGNASCTPFTIFGSTPVTISASGGGGSGVGTVATSGLETSGQVAIFGTSSGYPAKVYSVATSTPVIGSVLNYTGTLGSFVGGTSGTFGITNGAVTNAMLANKTIVVNSTTLTLGDAGDTITAASSTLLTNNNTFSGQNSFSNASTSLLTITTGWIPGLGTPTGTFLAVDPNGKIIATSSPAGAVASVANSDGTLTIFPTTGLVVASLALAHANTWTGVQTFGGTATPVIENGGNGLLIYNSANTFSTRLVPSSFTGNDNLTIPVLTGADTIATLGLPQSFTALDQFTNATSTLFSATTGWIGTLNLTNPLTIANGGTNQTSFSDYQLVASNAAGTQLVSTSSIGNSLLANNSIVFTTASPLGGAATVPLGGTLALTCSTCLTANQSITLSGDVIGSGATSIATAFALANSHWWKATQNFTNASTSEFTATSSVWFTNLATAAGTFLAVDPNGLLIATSTPSGSNSAFSPSANYATVTTLPSYTYSTGVITEVGTGALSVDGANPSVGQRVLVKNESGACMSGSGACNNGLYDVTAAGSGIAAFVLTRDSQYNSSSNIIPGIITYVISGTVNNDDFYAMTAAAPITVGTTGLTYVEVSGGGASVTSVSNSDGTLTISPTNGAIVASIALAHANSWTGLQTFSAASSTNFTAGGSNLFSVFSTGEVSAYDASTSVQGQLSPLRYLSFKIASSTAWTSTSTTASLYGDTAQIVMPFAGTIRSLTCLTSAGTLEIQATVNSLNIYYPASTTAGSYNGLATSFTKGQEMTVIGGNPATAPTWASCTLGATQNL